MNLIDKFEKAFFEEFDKLEGIEMERYIKENSKAIRFLCDNNPEMDRFVEESLEKHIVVHEVIVNYFPKLVRGSNPELLEHPEYLAYVFENKNLSLDRLRRVYFENDYIRNAFIKKYSNKKLLKNLKEKLLFF